MIMTKRETRKTMRETMTVVMEILQLIPETLTQEDLLTSLRFHLKYLHRPTLILTLGILTAPLFLLGLPQTMCRM